MVRLSDVTAADVISDVEMMRRLATPRAARLPTAPGQRKPQILARWSFDAASGRPVLGWIASA